jgi:hypothetical protein
MKKSRLTKLRLYAGVNNHFTKYKGFDPGASNGALIGGIICFLSYPRTYLLGLNINFN